MAVWRVESSCSAAPFPVSCALERARVCVEVCVCVCVCVCECAWVRACTVTGHLVPVQGQ